MRRALPWIFILALLSARGHAQTPLCRNGASGEKQCAGQLGGAGPTFYLNTGQSFVANGYVGIAGDGASTLAVNVTPWVAPCAGTIKNLRVYGFANTSGTVNIYLYKATAALTPSYAATAEKATVTSTFQGGDANAAHAFTVNTGDLVVGFSDAAWAANGASITSQFTPN
jgi:hypothetical protein